MEGFETLFQFVTLGTAVMTLACVMLTAGFKTVVETIWPHIKKAADENDPSKTYKIPIARWWSRVILPAIPVVLGGLMGLLPIDMLFGSIEDKGSRIFYGMVVGWLSTTFYKIIKKMIETKTGVKFPSTGISEPPPKG